MNCPVCNASVLDSSRFCHNCGAELSQAEKTTTDPLSPAPTHPMTQSERVDAVAALLAGKQCGACGYESCAKNAEAIVRGESSYDSCVSTDSETRQQIKALLDLQPRVTIWDSVWRWLTSVRLAIGLILALTLLSIVGTLLPQNAQPMSYIESLGMDLYRWVHTLQFDRLFQSWYFLALLFALLINTLCCTIKRSRASLRLLTKPMPDHDLNALRRMDYHFSVPLSEPSGALDRVKNYLIQQRFRVTKSDEKLKAHKRLSGRLGVDVLHISLVLVLASAALGTLFSYESFQVAHRGETFDLAQADFSVRVDNLWSESYASAARVKDWYTTLTVIDDNKEVLTQTIEVNHPLSYKGVSFFQSSFGSDWWEQGRYTIQVTRAENEADFGTHDLDSQGIIYVPEAQLTLSYITFFSDFALDENMQSYNRSGSLNNPALFVRLQVGDEPPYEAWAFSRNDMRGYYQTHMAADAAYHLNLVGMAAEQYTGLQISYNPAIPYIYAGFALMAIGLFLNFYWPPRWVWVTVEGQSLHLGANAHLSEDFETGLRALDIDIQSDHEREVSYAD
jgi:cytochrome c biogenesis protein